MLIVLEGPDGAGKTTLADAIIREILARDPNSAPVSRLPKGPPKHDGFTEYVHPLNAYRPGGGSHLVCDRWHIGELVYPNIFEREPVLDDLQWDYVDKFMKSRGGLMVHVDAPLGTLLNRVEERGSGETKNEVIRGRALFNTAMARTSMHRVSVGTGPGSLPADRQAKWLVDLAEREERDYAGVGMFPVYAGPVEPGVLVLGDTRGPKQPEIPTAFAPISGSSGHYLHRALDESGLELENVGFANVHEVDVAALWFTLDMPFTVVLGNPAWQTMRKTYPQLAPNFGYAPHPQFIRRFHHSSVADYGDVLRSAAFTQEDLRAWRP